MCVIDENGLNQLVVRDDDDIVRSHTKMRRPPSDVLDKSFLACFELDEVAQPDWSIHEEMEAREEIGQRIL